MLPTDTAAPDKMPVFGRSRPGIYSGRLTLRTNFLWASSGTIVYTACQWGMLVVLAKLGTAQMVGEFALALAITSPIMMSARLSLRSIQATDAAAEYDFGDYLAVRVLTTALAGLVLVGIACLSGYGWRSAAVILMVGLAKGLESISDIFRGLLQQHERMDRVGLAGMIEGPLSLAGIAATMYLTDDLLFGVCSWVIARVLVLVGYDVPNGVNVLREASGLARPDSACYSGLVRCLQLPKRPRALVTLTVLALPIGIVAALNSFSANIPRYFIERHLGTRDLGIFAALAYPLAAGTMVVGTLGQSAMPRLARHYADDDRHAFSSLLCKLLWMSLGMGAVGVFFIWLAGRPVLSLLYRPEYGAYVGTFLWLGVAGGLSYAASVLSCAMTAARCLRAPLPVFLTVIIVTVAGCMLFVPPYGLPGAAIAMTLAALCQMVGSALVIHHALRHRRVK